jgi:hypothetical protein
LAKRKIRPKRKREQKKPKSSKTLVIAAAAVIVVAAALLVMSGAKPQTGVAASQQQPQTIQQGTAAAVGDKCKSNMECFVNTCKSGPEMLSCVNTSSVETFYKRCTPATYTNVKVPYKDSSECACIEGLCKLLK